MSSLDNYRSFFRLCQFAGFLPFRMEINETTNQFQRFSFSWRYPITWWYSISSIASIVFNIFVTKEFFQTSEIVNLPFVIKITTKTLFILYIFLVSFSRYYFVSHYPALCKSIEYMHKIDTHQELNRHRDSKTLGKFRVISAIFSTCLAVRLAIKTQIKPYSLFMLGIIELLNFSKECRFLVCRHTNSAHPTDCKIRFCGNDLHFHFGSDIDLGRLLWYIVSKSDLLSNGPFHSSSAPSIRKVCQ